MMKILRLTGRRSIPAVLAAGVMMAVFGAFQTGNAQSAEDWVLIDDFENYTATEWPGGGSAGNVRDQDTPWNAHTNTDRIRFMEEGGNQFIAIGHQDPRGTSRTLEEAFQVAPGEAGTYFMVSRMGVEPDEDLDYSFGLAGESVDTSEHTPHEDYMVEARVLHDGAVFVNDGGDYTDGQDSSTVIDFGPEAWHNFWIVVDRTDTEDQWWALYHNTGAGAGATEGDRVSFNGNDTFALSGDDEETIQHIMLLAEEVSRPGDESRHLHFDDIYFSSGENLTHFNEPAQLAFDQVPDAGFIGETLDTVTVRIEDALGSVAVGADNEVTISLTGDPEGVTLNGTATVAAVDGVATFDDLSIDTAGTYTFTATADDLDSAESDSFSVAGPASQVSFDVQPSDGVEGRLLSAVTVRFEDENGFLRSDATSDVAVSLTEANGATLSGTLIVSAVDGIATFDDLRIDTAGTYTLSAEALSMDGDESDSFEIVTGLPLDNVIAHWSFDENTLTLDEGAIVGAEDSSPVGRDGSLIGSGTLTMTEGPFGDALELDEAGLEFLNFEELAGEEGADAYTIAMWVRPDPFQDDSAVIADWANAHAFWFRVGGGGSLRAQVRNTDGSDMFARQLSSQVPENEWSHVAWTFRKGERIGPGNYENGLLVTYVNGEPVDTHTVETSNQDFRSSNVGNDILANIGLKRDSGGWFLGGLDEIWVFTDALSQAQVQELAVDNVAPVVGPAAQLAFDDQPDSALSGETLAPVTVRIEDEVGALRSDADNEVTLSLTDAGDATLNGTLTVAAVDGIATFDDLSVDTASGGDFTLTASGDGLDADESDTFSIAGSPAQVAFDDQPANVLSGDIMDPVTVRIEDENGNLRSDAENDVTVALTEANGATLSGELTVAAVDGIATFDDLSVDIGGVFTLTASGDGLDADESEEFIVVGPATQLAIQDQPTDGRPDTVLSPVTVRIEDENGGLRSDADDEVTISLTEANGATLSGTLTVAADGGIATFDTLTIDTAGTYTLTAEAAGLGDVETDAFEIFDVGTLPEGLVAHYTFDDGTADDFSGNNLHGSLEGTAEVVNDPERGMVLSLDGEDGKVDLGNPEGLNIVGEITVAAWINIAEFGPDANQAILQRGHQTGQTGPSREFVMRISGATEESPSYDFGTWSPNHHAEHDVPAEDVGAWVHLAGTMTDEGGGNFTYRLYHNGVEVDVAEGGSGMMDDFNVGWAIGARGGVSGFERLFNGMIDDLQIYNVALSEGGIAAAMAGEIGGAAQLAFDNQPSDALSGETLDPVTVRIEDENGNRIQDANHEVTVALTEANGADLSGTLTVAAVNGIATFGDLSIDQGGEFTLTATADDLDSAESDSFNIVGSATQLAFDDQPSDALAGESLGTVTVRIEDALGALRTDADDEVTLSLTEASGATLNGTLTVAAENGIATFDDLSVDTTSGVVLTLTAEADGLDDAESDAFTVVGDAEQLAFDNQPGDSPPGAVMGAVTVRIEDDAGNLRSDAEDEVTLSLDDANGATLSGTLTVEAVDGVATFDDLSIDVSGTYTITASADGLTDVTSDPFTIAAGTAFDLANFSFEEPVAEQTDSEVNMAQQMPGWTVTMAGPGGGSNWGVGNPAAGFFDGANPIQSDLPEEERLFDGNQLGFINVFGSRGSDFGEAVSNPVGVLAEGAVYDLSVVVAVRTGQSGWAADYEIGLRVDDGTPDEGADIGTFSTVSVEAGEVVDLNYILNASADADEHIGEPFRIVIRGTSGGQLNFDNVRLQMVGAGAQLAFDAQPGEAHEGQTLSPVTVRIEDEDGFLRADADDEVSVSLTDANGATLDGTVSVAAVNGIATFDDLSIDTAGTYTLTAEAAGMADAQSEEFEIHPGPTQIVFDDQPSDALVAESLGTVTVRIEDSEGNLVEIADGDVTVSLTDPGEATLAGTTTVAAEDGIATFDDLSVDLGGIYTLTANFGGLDPAESDPFEISYATVGPDVIAHWSFDADTLTLDNGNILAIADNSPTGRDATPGIGGTGGGSGTAHVSEPFDVDTSIVPGRFGDALRFSGDNFLLFDNLTELMESNGAPSYTVSMWVRTEEVGQGVGSRFSGLANWGNEPGSAGPTRFTYGFGPQSGSQMAAQSRFDNNSTNGGDIFSRTVTVGDAPMVNDGEWHMLSWTFDTETGELRSYFDGSLEETFQSTASSFAMADSSSAVGGLGIKGDSGDFIPEGVILDEVWVVADVLTETDIQALYEENASPMVGEPVQLAFDEQPSATVIDEQITPVTVRIEDELGRLRSDAVNNVTVALTDANGAELSGTLTVAAEDGIATFDDLIVDTVGSYTLTATAGGMDSAESAEFDIVEAPTQLAFDQQPVDAALGELITVTVRLELGDGTLVEAARNEVTLSLDDANGATLGGDTTVAAEGGIASFLVSVDLAGGYTLSASGDGLDSATSDGFEIDPGAFTIANFSFEEPEAEQTEGEVNMARQMPGWTVTMSGPGGQSNWGVGNPAAGFFDGANPIQSDLPEEERIFDGNQIGFINVFGSRGSDFGETVSDPAGVLVEGGVYDLNVVVGVRFRSQEDWGADYEIGLRVDDGTPDGGADIGTFATASTEFGESVDLHYVLSASAEAGEHIGQPFRIVIRGTSNGQLNFDNVRLNVDLIGDATQLAFDQQPLDTIAGQTMAPVSVRIEDANGVLRPDSDEVTLSLTDEAPGIALTGTTTVEAVNGIATFDDLVVEVSGPFQSFVLTNSLTAEVEGLDSAQSDEFNIVAGPTQVAFDQQPSDGDVNETLDPVTVRIEDGAGNLVQPATNEVTLELTDIAPPEPGFYIFDDFQAYSLDSSIDGQNGWAVTNAEGTVVEDPFGESDNQVLAITGGGPRVWNNTVPTIPEEGEGTLYFRFATSDFTVDDSEQRADWLLGLSPSPTFSPSPGFDDVWPSVRPIGNTGDDPDGGELTIRDGGGFATQGNFSIETWYEVWVLTTHEDGEAPSYDVYVRGGPEWPEQTQVASDFAYRTSPETPSELLTLVIMGGGGHEGPVYVDDIGFDTEAHNLGVPDPAPEQPVLNGTLTAAAENGIATFDDLSVTMAGTFTLTATSPGLESDVSASFTIAPPVETFDDWVARHGLSGDDADLMASPARDGVANLLKYALDLDPNVPATSGDLPQVGEDEEGNLTLTFVRRTDLVEEGVLEYVPEASDDVTDWNADDVEEIGTEEIDENSERVTVRATLSGDTVFLHLLVRLLDN